MAILRRLKAPTLSNTGSTARDHLASERTFLAWIRTGLGFIALGMAVERFSRLDLDTLMERISHEPTTDSAPSSSSSSRPENLPASPSTLSTREHLLVGLLLGTGGGSIFYAITRYFSNMLLLQRGQFRPAYLGSAGLGLAVTSLGGGVYLAAVQRETRKRK